MTALERHLGAIAIGAHQLRLAVPQGRQVQLDVGGHAQHHHAAPRAGDGDGIGQRLRRGHRVDGDVGARAERLADHSGACRPAHGPAQLVGRDRQVCAQLSGQAALAAVAGAHHDGRHAREPPQCRHREQTERAGADHCGGAAVGHLRSQCGVDASGGGLDHHGGLVAQVVGAERPERVQLRAVRREHLRPAAAGRGARAGLEAGFDLAADQVAVVVAVCRRGARPWRGRAVRLRAQHRLEHHAGAVVSVAHHFVARHERERHQRLEIARHLPVHRR